MVRVERPFLRIGAVPSTLHPMTPRGRRTILATLTVALAVGTFAFVVAPDIGVPVGVSAQRASGSPGTSGSPSIEVPASPPPRGAVITADVVVYGATPSGILAAVSAARQGASVVLVTPEAQVGGMMTSGIGHPDIGRQGLIGGLTRSVFLRIRRAERLRSPVSTAPWSYEPHIAEAVFEAILRESHVVVYLDMHLDRTRPAELDGNRIAALRMTDGTRLAGRVFIDATYEGDVMAAAGVPSTIGRESDATYGESLAGVDVDEPANPSATLVDGLDASGRPLPGIDVTPFVQGAADGLVQSANFRLCVTTDPSNRLPFRPPAGYDAAAYVLVGRAIAKVHQRTGAAARVASVLTFTRLPGRKFDLNNFGLYSTDLVGGATSWATADDATRQSIMVTHRTWVAGLLWYLETNPAVPPSLRRDLRRWGLCADEFAATGGWPPELYIREARRMVGSVVLTQRDLQRTVTKPDSIAIGSYRIDGHYIRRVLGPDHLVRGDGQLSAATLPFQIPYDVIVPPPGAVDNLIVSVTISASHVAWASIRTEPTLMQIGEAAGVAAALAARQSIGVREVSYGAIRAVLLARGGILAVPPVVAPVPRRSGLMPPPLPGPQIRSNVLVRHR